MRISVWGLMVGLAAWRSCSEELPTSSREVTVEGNYLAATADTVEVLLNDLNYDEATMSEEQMAALRKAKLGDRIAIRAIAQGLTYEKSAFGKMNLPLAAKLYQYSLSRGDVPSMVNLGTMYAEGHGVDRSLQKALDLFVAASKSGHQGATYNVGLLLAEGGYEEPDEHSRVRRDVVTAFEFFHLAYSMRDRKGPAIVNKATTDAAKQAYLTLSDSIAFESWGLEPLSRIFQKGSLMNTTLDRPILQRWSDGLEHLHRFNDGFASGVGVINTARRQELLLVLNQWGYLIDFHKEQLSKLQIHLILDNLQDVMGPLAGNDDNYVVKAGELAEALAVSEYCSESYAIDEDDTACFNGAISAAMSYYRRAGKKEDATRAFDIARKHPHASTNWQHQSQTPRVYHKGLRASPWWDEQQFSIVRALESAFKRSKESILKELDIIVKGKEGAKVRRGGNIRTENLAEAPPNPDNGLERIFTPHIGVRVDDDATEIDGAGGWSEFGPLFDGLDWSQSRCNALPTLCDILKKHAHSGEMCGLSHQELHTYEKMQTTEQHMRQLVDLRCGADTIATILRLRPGTKILPHCGTTNRRLIMHFAIRGADKVRFRTGDADEQAIPGGWVHDYGGGDGHAIIFDDSF